MKHIQIKLSLVAVLFATATWFASCKRDHSTNKDLTDTTLAKDNAMSEFFYNDALNIADEASITLSGDNLANYKTTSNCATVTHDTLSTPKTITIDFGTTNCLCNDGRNRRGKILVSYMGHYKDSASIHTITFDQYYVNDNHVMGSKTVENMGHNANGFTYFNITVNGLIVKATTLDSIVWNQNRVRTWVQGENTNSKLDDVYEITGSGNGTKANGVSYTMNITQPLVKAIDCANIKAGEMTIQPTGGYLRTINFGNGTCDNIATVTINGTTYTITLN